MINGPHTYFQSITDDNNYWQSVKLLLSQMSTKAPKQIAITASCYIDKPVEEPYM